jgi:hypothetical protein
MLLSPILSYITFGLMGLMSITYYFTQFTFFYGIIFIIVKGKTAKIPSFLYLFIIYSVYQSIWSFANGGFERRGLFQILVNRDIAAIIFIIIIIYNTDFNERFIKKSILIIKITVIIAALVSLIQVVDFSFMDSNPIWANGAVGNTLFGDLYLDRRGSIFGYINQNEMGLSYMPLLSVLIGILLYQRYRFYYFFLILGGISAILCNARYVMVAFLLITIQVLIAQKIKIKGLFKFLILFSISGFLFIQILLYFGYDFHDWYNTRLFAEGSLKETTRYKAIGTFLKFFPQHVLFGFGGPTEEMVAASNAVGSSQIHVGYLAHLTYYGITGSFFLFGFWFLLAKKLYKTAKLTNYWGSFFAFLTFLWANVAMVYFSIFFYGIIFALVLDKYYQDKFSEKNVLLFMPSNKQKD